jgi:hypothetical protein
MRLRGSTDFGKPTRITCKNEEVEMAFRGYLRTRRSDLYHDGGNWKNMLCGVVLRNNCAAAIMSKLNFAATA